ncbi:MAG: hypothetical protein L6R41_006024 [Letrouitia leprolyta]|nr:MAG: hypothetical protein L6R41_006024 [Letrouitia leprolyta]
MAAPFGYYRASHTNTSPSVPTLPPPAHLSDLRNDPDLWYRIRILLHDLNNIKEHAAEKRLSSTPDELYISEPYFTPSEANKVRTTLISHTKDQQQITIQDALHQDLEILSEKRRASGDARPCGPHDMFPVCCGVFGVKKEELKDEKFLARLGRTRLGEVMSTGKKNTARGLSKAPEAKAKK